MGAAVLVGLAGLACKGSSSNSTDNSTAAPTDSAAATTAPSATETAAVDTAKPQATVAAKPKSVCKDGYQSRVSEGITVCVRTCKKDSDCENPPCESDHICENDDEEPTLAAASAKPGGNGKARALPGPTIDQVAIPTNDQGDVQGSCPTTWIGLPGGMCNRPCKQDSDCHADNKCQKLGTQRFCDDHEWDSVAPSSTGFDPTAPHGPCPAGQTEVMGGAMGTHSVCMKSCKSDSDCKGGSCVTKTDQGGDPHKVCDN
jgi:hypothetical protein